MRTGFLYSLYLFSSFVQGSLFLSAAMLSRMPAPSHARCPHVTCHTVATQTPHLGLTQGQTPNTIRTSQRSIPGHRAARSRLQPRRLASRDREGCVQLPASPGSSQGLAFKGDHILKRKTDKVTTLHFRGSANHEGERCSSSPLPANQGPRDSPKRLQSGQRESEERASPFHRKKGNSWHKGAGELQVFQMIYSFSSVKTNTSSST